MIVVDLLLLLADFGTCDGPPADIDGDGCVTVVDLLTLIANLDQTDLRLVLGNFGPCDGWPEEVSGDGVVDGSDVAAVATHFGPGLKRPGIAPSGPRSISVRRNLILQEPGLPGQ